MRIKLFKLFEGRSFELTEQDFIDLLNKNCKDFIKNPTILQRNKDSEGDAKFYCVNPKSYVRTSMKTSNSGAGVKSNHGTLLMDNLPSWLEYPKRSQSIIGVTSFNTSLAFGNSRFLVIPFDGAKFGVCPSSDLWGIKCSLMDHYQFSFDDNLSNMFIDLKITDKSYDEMMSELQILYDTWMQGKSMNVPFSQRSKELFRKMDELGFKDVREGLNNIFSPENFVPLITVGEVDVKGFHCLNYDELLQYKKDYINSNHKEFWTDSECLLFKIDNRIGITKEKIINSFNEMVNKYCKNK